MENNTLNFYRDIKVKKNIIIPCILGTFFLLFELYAGSKSHYISLFFYAVGTISFAFSFIKYAILSEDRLSIFYGPFFRRKKIIVSRENILDLESDQYERKVGVGGQFGGVALNILNNVILITLEKRIEPQAHTDIAKWNRRAWNDEIEINGDGTSLLLKRPPKGGFSLFIDSYNSNGKNYEKNSSKIKPPMILGITNIILLLFCL